MLRIRSHVNHNWDSQINQILYLCYANIFLFLFGNIFNDFVKISDYILKYRSKMTMIISIKVSTIKIIFNEKSLIRILKNHTNLTWYGYIIHLIFYFSACILILAIKTILSSTNSNFFIYFLAAVPSSLLLASQKKTFDSWPTDRESWAMTVTEWNYPEPGNCYRTMNVFTQVWRSRGISGAKIIFR